jgi:hypothetical protein
MTKIRILRTLLILLALACLDANAHRKTDILYFYNGDRLTGEIRHLENGLLEVKTDSMGTINVEWQDIAFLESAYNYDIRLTDGTRLFGSLAKAELPGEVQVLEPAGEQSLQSITIVELRPIDDEWKERIDAYFSLGYSYNKASAVAQTTFNTELNYPQENATNTLTARQIHTVTNEEVTRSSRLEYTRAVWTEKSGRFRATWGSYESNDELGLQHRYAAGIGIGKVFRDTPRLHWTGTVGLQALTEQENMGGKEEQALEGLLVSNFKMWQLNSPKLDLSFSVSLYPNFSNFRRVRGDTDLRLSWEIYKDLFWDVTAFGTFDNASETNNSSDYGVTTGLGWKY